MFSNHCSLGCNRKCKVSPALILTLGDMCIEDSHGALTDIRGRDLALDYCSSLLIFHEANRARETEVRPNCFGWHRLKNQHT